MLADTYVKQAIKTCEEHLDSQGLKLKTKVSATLPSRYRSELDISEELNEKGANQPLPGAHWYPVLVNQTWSN
jgi:hypothetical protein